MTNKESTRRVKVSIIKQAAKFNGCVTCGYAIDSSKLDFHHLHGKKAYISKLRGVGEVLDELLKCVVLCQKCHVKVTKGKIVLAEHLTFQVNDLECIAGYVNFNWKPKEIEDLSDIPF